MQVGDTIRTSYYGMEVLARVEHLKEAPFLFIGVTLLEDGFASDGGDFYEGDTLLLEDHEIIEVL